MKSIRRILSSTAFLVIVVPLLICSLAALASGFQKKTTRPTTRPVFALVNPDLGPETVIFKELSEKEGFYDPVPFDHRGHAEMAETGGGCVTCHHQSPDQHSLKTNGADINIKAIDGHSQSDSAKHPACKTCHDPRHNDPKTLGLKGALHKQCLDCHKEWSGDNKCTACHTPRGSGSKPNPTVDEALGRMHPPTAMPDVRIFKAHFSPADGANVLFRHKQHVDKFGLRCVTCHQGAESCARCHNPEEAIKMRDAKRVIIDRPWEQVHFECKSCHDRDKTKCNHCHFKDEEPPPAPFDHAMTGQILDDAHAVLQCANCHGSRTDRAITGMIVKQTPTCGGAACHAREPEMAFPDKRPGPVVPVVAKAPLRRPLIPANLRPVPKSGDEK